MLQVIVPAYKQEQRTSVTKVTCHTSKMKNISTAIENVRNRFKASADGVKR